MLTCVTRGRGLLVALLIAAILAIGTTTFTGFATKAGAAALRQTYAPIGATGTGNNAPPPGTEPLAPGLWDAQNYRIPYHVTSCPQPPQSAAARIALANAPTLLDYYGLPQPSLLGGKNDIQQWQTVVSTMTHHSCDETIPVIAGQFVVNYGFSRNNQWGGWGNNTCTNCNSYIAAQFVFYVPTVYGTTGELHKDSIWVGQGGANGDPLAQTGVSEYSQGGSTDAAAFYETIGCPGYDNYEHDLFYPNFGDEMYFFTNTYGQDVLDDISTGNYKTKNWGCGSNDSDEFIVERNGVNDFSNAPLDNYGSVTAYSAQYEDSTRTWWGVDENSGGYGDGFYSWGLYGYSGCHCYLETQNTPSTSSHASTWTWTWHAGW